MPHEIQDRNADSDETLEELIRDSLNSAEKDRRPVMERTAEWLSSLDSEEQGIEIIQAAWTRFGSPLDELASSIRELNILTSNRDIRIELILNSRQIPKIGRAAPMEINRATELIAHVPSVIKNQLLKILMYCPGISVGGEGILANEHNFIAPMTEIEMWVSQVRQYRHEWESAGAEFPDPAKYAGELLETTIGDIYVFDKNARVVFFDHEENEFIPCSVDVESLVRMYLEKPDTVIEPDVNGWTNQ